MTQLLGGGPRLGCPAKGRDTAPSGNSRRPLRTAGAARTARVQMLSGMQLRALALLALVCALGQWPLAAHNASNALAMSLA